MHVKLVDIFSWYKYHIDHNVPSISNAEKNERHDIYLFILSIPLNHLSPYLSMYFTRFKRWIRMPLIEFYISSLLLTTIIPTIKQ